MGTMNNVGVTPKSLHQKWQFGVEIDGFTAAYFTKANLPEVEFEVTKFAPGGAIFDQKAPGRATFNDVTLEMGVPQDNAAGEELMEWLKLQIDIPNNVGACAPEDAMKDVDIIEFSRCGEEIRRWRLHDAFIKTAKFGELDGSSSDNSIRSATIAYNYFSVE